MISDVIAEAMDGMIDYVMDDLGQLDFECYDQEFVYTDLLPVLTTMNALLYELNAPTHTPTGDPLRDPLTCLYCQQTFPDVLQLWRHRRTSPNHDPSAADVAMLHAAQRPDVTMTVRGDLMPIQELSTREEREGVAVITEAESYVVSTPADCPHCQDFRETFTEHMRREHPTPAVE
jgi:hypothetical protein